MRKSKQHRKLKKSRNVIQKLNVFYLSSKTDYISLQTEVKDLNIPQSSTHPNIFDEYNTGKLK